MFFVKKTVLVLLLEVRSAEVINKNFVKKE
jgi:hypothetical protein